MTRIELKTTINSSITICFDLSRSIELHQISTAAASEKVIAGRCLAYVKNDLVTWQAKNFGIYQQFNNEVN
jgi:hypothetical protein